MSGLLDLDLGRFLAFDRVLRLPGAPGKREVLARLVEATAADPQVTDKAAFAQAIEDREEVTSTGIGGGVAVPHARLPSVVGFVISIAVVPGGVDFQAQDRRPVNVLVMIAATDQDRKTYLRVLASVAARLKSPHLVADLIAASDARAVLERFLA